MLSATRWSRYSLFSWPTMPGVGEERREHILASVPLHAELEELVVRQGEGVASADPDVLVVVELTPTDALAGLVRAGVHDAVVALTLVVVLDQLSQFLPLGCRTPDREEAHIALTRARRWRVPVSDRSKGKRTLLDCRLSKPYGTLARPSRACPVLALSANTSP